MIGTAGRTVRGSVFVGREAELAALAGALDAARNGSPQIVWIEGEPGIGKTAFMRRFRSSASDLTVLEASGDESETALDYGVVQQLFAQAGPSSDWTALEQHAPASSFSVGADLLRMLGTVQEDAAAVIAIDDAHWIDAASAAALLFALRRLHGDRVLVLIVSRPGGLERLGPSWSRLLADADRVLRISLPGLSGAEVGELAVSLGIGPLTLAARERLREHTSGHPLYVRALLSELPPERLNFADGELPAPHSFAATVLSRLTNIGTEAQNLVSAAAVAGSHCQLSLAAALAELSEPLPALEEALSAELLTFVPAHVTQEIAFPHPLVRAAVYEDLSPTRRRALHLACASLMSGTPALAHRVAASSGDDNELAAELQRNAEAEVSASRLTAGVERFLWATRIAGDRDLCELALMRAVECLVLAGNIPEANSHMGELLSCRDSARRSYTLGILTAAAGRLIEAEAMLRRTLARPDYVHDADLEGPVNASLAVIYALVGRAEEGVALARRAMATGAVTAVTAGRQALAVSLLMSGSPREGIATLAFLSASRVEPEPFEAEMLTSRGRSRVWWGDLDGAAEDLGAAVRWSRAGFSLRSLPDAYGGLAEIDYRTGRWDAGLTHADVAVSLGEDSDRAWDLPYVHAIASLLDAGRGNWRSAADHVESARRAAEATPLPMCIYNAALAGGHLAWVRCEWDAVLHALSPVQLLLDGGPPPGLGQRAVQAIAAEALLSTGRLEDAEAMLERLEAGCGDAPERSTEVELWRLRGMLANARRRPAQARAAFERATAAAQFAESPLTIGLLELSHGQFLRRGGSRRAAMSALRLARDRFARLGARPFVTRCETELTACGVRPRENGGENRYGLSPREDVVARLVASGKTNREVAEELYLSTKAIEYHLGNVFTKMNVRSRHELASRLAPGGAQNDTAS